MKLKLLPPLQEEVEPQLSSKPHSPQKGFSTAFKLIVLSLQLCCIPLVAFSIGVNLWDIQSGARIGFLTSVTCMLFAAYVIYATHWLDESDDWPQHPY